MWLTILSFMTIAALITLLISRKAVPMAILIVVPIISGLLCGRTMPELTKFAFEGIRGMTNVFVMIMFAVTFFSTMMDNGVFDVLINALIRKIKLNVPSIMLLTGVVTIITHVDGSAVTTYIITFTLMIPLYKKFNIRMTSLLGIGVLISGVMNMVPWGGPTLRLASAIQMDVVEFYKLGLSTQIAGLIFCFGYILFLARQEIKLGAGLGAGETVETESLLIQDRSGGNKTKFILNCFLIVAVIGLMLNNKIIPVPGFVLMIGSVLAFFLNYPTMKQQQDKLLEFSPNILGIAFTLIGAGTMVGIFKGTGMINEMAITLAGWLPHSIGQFTHIIVAAFSAPILMSIDVDTYVFGIMPVIIGIGEQFGITPVQVATAFLLTSASCVLQPYTASTWVGIGVMNTDLTTYWKASAKIMFITMIFMLAFGILTGVNLGVL
jgi:CitMHS family citrate-Mg2+:H+ or citrate-Ca2+:H+ symporter